jgi:hypothetical protein
VNSILFAPLSDDIFRPTTCQDRLRTKMTNVPGNKSVPRRR